MLGLNDLLESALTLCKMEVMKLQNRGHGHKFNQFKKRKGPKHLELKIENKKCKYFSRFCKFI